MCSQAQHRFDVCVCKCVCLKEMTYYFLDNFKFVYIIQMRQVTFCDAHTQSCVFARVIAEINNSNKKEENNLIKSLNDISP